jgi:hypothetical protein
MRLKMGLGAAVLIGATLFVLNSCNRTTTTVIVWPNANPPAKAVIKTKHTPWSGRWVTRGHVVVDELVFQYGDYSVRVTGDKIGVEDPNLKSLHWIDSVALFHFEEVLALRLVGSDGGFSNITVLVFRSGKLVHSESMWLEDYSLLLSQGHEDSDFGNNEDRGLEPWLAKHSK